MFKLGVVYLLFGSKLDYQPIYHFRNRKYLFNLVKIIIKKPLKSILLKFNNFMAKFFV
jgi:hypothetical protein